MCFYSTKILVTWKSGSQTTVVPLLHCTVLPWLMCSLIIFRLNVLLLQCETNMKQVSVWVSWLFIKQTF